MNRTYYRWLVVILVIWAAVIWADLPNNPGIHIGGFNRTMQTQEGLDLRGGMRVLLEVDLPADASVTAQELQDAKQILQSRSNALGVSEVTFQTSGTRRIVGEFPGLTQTDQVVAALRQVGQLAFVDAGTTGYNPGTQVNVDYSGITSATTTGTPSAATPSAAPTETATATPTETATPQTTATPAAGATATPEAIPTLKAIMNGSMLASVTVTTGSIGTGTAGGNYAISFTLKDNAKQLFADFTANNIGKYLCIVLDNQVISCPTINSSIPDGKGEISGNFTYDSANNLAVQLRYGALPVPLKVVETRSVGASLGADSVNKSITAGLIGLLMVAILMVVNYRLPGVIADLALVMYTMTTFALYKLIPVTLTLPGIAGFVLSIGVAVDANILIFERLKEEMRAGYNLHQAIDLAWKRAWPSIRDSNISTLITCVILFWYGSQFGATIVTGFSLTLALGVLVSLFTAIVATRTFLHLVLDNIKGAEHPRWFAQ
jgi:preprotein translocase subunit SecD